MSQKKTKKKKTKKKSNKQLQIQKCTMLQKLNGNPDNDLDVYNHLLENDPEVKTIISDLKSLTQKADSNIATIKAGINGLMKTELDTVSFNVGGTAPLYEMIYHINENLNNHIRENSFTTFQTKFIKAANKHAKIEAEYMKDHTKTEYKKLKNKLQKAEKEYNKTVNNKANKKKYPKIYTTPNIPDDGVPHKEFVLKSAAEIPVEQRTMFTLISDTFDGETVYKRNKKALKYAEVRSKAKKLTGTIK